jgi:hypothetical protein
MSNNLHRAALAAPIVMSLLVLNAVAQAQETSFPAGTWTLQLYPSGTTSSKGDIFTMHSGAGYYVWDNVSINLEALAGRIDSSIGPNASVNGLDLLLRWHVVDAGKWTLYLDGGAGLQRATQRFPDTHFNFRPQLGVGATFRLTEQVRLMGGARYLHISNAGRSDPNSGYDGAMGYVGLMINF